MIIKVNKQELKDSIKQWMLDTGAFRILDVIDPQFHFCLSLQYLQNEKMPLIHKANIKQFMHGKDCTNVMWERDTSSGNPNVKNVMHDQNLKNIFFTELDEQVDPKYNRFKFIPNGEDFTKIRFEYIFPTNLSQDRSYIKNETLDSLQLFIRLANCFDLVARI